VDSLRNAMDRSVRCKAKLTTKSLNCSAGTAGCALAMIAVEKANLSFQMMVQVRNKIVQAYQQISAIPF